MSIPNFRRPYNRTVITKPNPRIGRGTHCDACECVQPDCLWVRRQGIELCLCARCRSQAWAAGTLEHIDAEYPEVAL